MAFPQNPGGIGGFAPGSTDHFNAIQSTNFAIASNNTPVPVNLPTTAVMRTNNGNFSYDPTTGRVTKLSSGTRSWIVTANCTTAATGVNITIGKNGSTVASSSASATNSLSPSTTWEGLMTQNDYIIVSVVVASGAPVNVNPVSFSVFQRGSIDS